MRYARGAQSDRPGGVDGAQAGRATELDPPNVQGGRIILRPGQTKSGKARVVPLPPDGMALVEDLPFSTTGTSFARRSRRREKESDVRSYDFMTCATHMHRYWQKQGRR